MSLKMFHLVFISAAVLLAAGCGIWELKDYWSPEGQGSDLVIGLCSLAAAAGLIVYERYFLKKLKKVSYL
jgi:hypothetical protein